MISHTIWYYIYFFKEKCVSKNTKIWIFSNSVHEKYEILALNRKDIYIYELLNYKKLNEKCFTEIKIKLIKKEGI
jgi:hypothetical protein